MSQLKLETEQALEAAQGMVCFSLAIFGMLLLSDLYGFFGKLGWFKRRKETPAHEHYFWLKLTLFANVLCGLVTLSIFAVSLFNVPFDAGSSLCNFLLKSSLFTYTLSFQSVLAFFIYRVLIVEELPLSATYKYISTLSKFGLFIGIPIMNTIIAIFAFQTSITEDGVCVIRAAVWVPIVLSFVFCLVTGLMQYLFISPIQASLSVLNSLSFGKLKRLMVRNIVLSLISLLVALLGLAVFAVLHAIASEPDYHHILALIPPMVEMVVTTICARLMIVDESQFERALSYCCLRGVVGSEKPPKNAGLPEAQQETLPLPSSGPVPVLEMTPI